MVEQEQILKDAPESLIPVFNISPFQEKKVLMEEGWSLAEAFYEAELERKKANGVVQAYLCAPLKGSQNRPVQLNIARAIGAASQILGSTFSDRPLSLWVPHLHGFAVFNEVVYPDARDRAIAFNHRILSQFFDVMIVDRGAEDTLSQGMLEEIVLARANGTQVVSMNTFKETAQGLPDQVQTDRNYRNMVEVHNQIHGPTFRIE